MQKMKPLQILVAPADHRRVEKLAKASGLKVSPWLRQIVMLVTQDSEAGRKLRNMVALSMMAPDSGAQ